MLTVVGRRALARGLRARNPFLTFVGGLLVARAVIRYFSRPDRELLFEQKVKPGEGLRIRTVPGGEEIEIRG